MCAYIIHLIIYDLGAAIATWDAVWSQRPECIAARYGFGPATLQSWMDVMLTANNTKPLYRKRSRREWQAAHP